MPGGDRHNDERRCRDQPDCQHTPPALPAGVPQRQSPHCSSSGDRQRPFGTQSDRQQRQTAHQRRDANQKEHDGRPRQTGKRLALRDQPPATAARDHRRPSAAKPSAVPLRPLSGCAGRRLIDSSVPASSLRVETPRSPAWPTRTPPLATTAAITPPVSDTPDRSTATEMSCRPLRPTTSSARGSSRGETDGQRGAQQTADSDQHRRLPEHQPPGASRRETDGLSSPISDSRCSMFSRNSSPTSIAAAGSGRS